MHSLWIFSLFYWKEKKKECNHSVIRHQIELISIHFISRLSHSFEFAEINLWHANLRSVDEPGSQSFIFVEKDSVE